MMGAEHAVYRATDGELGQYSVTLVGTPGETGRWSWILVGHRLFLSGQAGTRDQARGQAEQAIANHKHANMET